MATSPTDRKAKMALISKFESEAKKANMTISTVNRYSAQWAAGDILDSFGKDETYAAVEYYFRVNRYPSWAGFTRNIEELIRGMHESERDNELRKKRREEFKRLMDEFGS